MISTELERLANPISYLTIYQKMDFYPFEIDYYKYIKNMSDTRNPNADGLKDYAEDRCFYLALDVKAIRPYAFREYTCLQALYLKNSSVVQIFKNSFYGVNPIIYVPSNLLAQ